MSVRYGSLKNRHKLPDSSPSDLSPRLLVFNSSKWWDSFSLCLEAFPPSFSFSSFSTRSFLTCGSVNVVTPGPLLALSSQRCPPSSRLQHLAPHICSVPTFLAASVPPGAGPPETGASARDSGLEEVSKSRSRDPELPVSGPGCGVVRLKARPNSSSQSLPPHIRPDMHQIYTKPHASATSQISVTIWGKEGSSIKTFEFSRDISYSIHSRNHITIQPKMCRQVVHREKAIPSLWTFTSDLPPWQKL